VTTLKEAFEDTYEIRLVRKDALWVMRAVGWLLRILPSFRRGEFITTWWTTYRLPWQSRPTLAYPTRVLDPMSRAYFHTRSHELVHANDMRTFLQLVRMLFLYTLVPLPVFYSGRWIVERRAYLNDIETGVYTPTEAAEILWHNYAWPWPRQMMVDWFMENEERRSL
jgi:hypothetical protein